MRLTNHGTHPFALLVMGNQCGQLLNPEATVSESLARDALQGVHTNVRERSLVLALNDLYLVVNWVWFGYAVLNLILPHRVYPPRAPAPQTPAR